MANGSSFVSGEVGIQKQGDNYISTYWHNIKKSHQLYILTILHIMKPVYIWSNAASNKFNTQSIGSEDCNKCSKKKEICLRILTKKGGPSSNRISFKWVNLTHYRGTCVLPKLRKKGQISWFKGTWACVFSLDLTLTDWDRCRLGCRPPLAV